MDEEAKAGISGFVSGIIIGGVAVLVWMAQCVPGTRAAHAEAVKHGAGRWVVSDEGETKFEWTTTKEK